MPTDECPLIYYCSIPVVAFQFFKGTHSKGWTKAKVKGTFLNTASITKKKGAKLATKATGITRIALVASKGKGHGVVKVMLGKKTLKKVSLAQTRNVKKKVVPLDLPAWEHQAVQEAHLRQMGPYRRWA